MQSWPTRKMQSYSQVGRFAKYAFDYLKCTFAESLTFEMQSCLRVGRLSKCAFGKSADCRTSLNSASWPARQMRIWRVGRLAKCAFSEAATSRTTLNFSSWTTLHLYISE